MYSFKLNYLENIWNSRSNESKDLISKMLKYDYKERITAEECLNHPWFKRHALPVLDNELTN